MKAFLAFLLASVSAEAQLVVEVSKTLVAGQKAIVPLVLKNNFAETVESARAAVFLTDVEGKVVAQGTRWVINGSEGTRGLKSGSTNTFNFVVNAQKPFASTNISAKIVFSRVVLKGGKVADPAKDVQIVSE
ncbi:MAG TPA: hypothetical protein VEH04_01690 [Verrucomicrobiae bacterium]|nr:hypothetical protein [Verrucomicrobiae bacterium]